jgi:hypothetical protein
MNEIKSALFFCIDGVKFIYVKKHSDLSVRYDTQYDGFTIYDCRTTKAR